MKVFQIFVTLAAVGVSNALVLTDADIIAARPSSGSATIEKRACDYNTPCKGYGRSPGLFCGDGNYGCEQGHVYQVGTGGGVCNFGVRDWCIQ